jgi:hypothetical protein
MAGAPIVDGKVDKKLALDIWLGLYGPIDDKWHQVFLLDRDLDYICECFTVEQITEAFGRWKRLEDARQSLDNKHRPGLRQSHPNHSRPYSQPIWMRPYDSK